MRLLVATFTTSSLLVSVPSGVGVIGRLSLPPMASVEIVIPERISSWTRPFSVSAEELLGMNVRELMKKTRAKMLRNELSQRRMRWMRFVALVLFMAFIRLLVC